MQRLWSFMHSDFWRETVLLCDRRGTVYFRTGPGCFPPKHPNEYLCKGLRDTFKGAFKDGINMRTLVYKSP